MITAHMATMSAVGLLTDVTTMLNITAIALCSQLLAPAAVPSEGVLRQQTHILTLEYETHLLLPIQHGVTSTGMIEGDALIELIITIVEADHLIPPSRGTRLLNAPQGKPQKLPILLKEPLCHPEEAQDQDLIADLQARTPDDRRPPYHEFTAERAYYENIRTTGLYQEDARREYAARSRERFPELEHYQGEHFDPRYHEDPRDYRDYRDPFEQDIRKYTYIQRERERERERFEADRSRWSPSHPRRAITPTISPSPSERATRDSERRVYSQSSERSGSVSSMSPPHFDKSEKALLDHAAKSEKSTQSDQVAGAEKPKRPKRKDKTDKEKAEKGKSRKAKGQSPANQIPETEPDVGFDGGSGRGRGSDQDVLEKQKCKVEGDSLSGNQLATAFQDSVKSEMNKVDIAELDGKTRLKKHPKSDIGNDGKDSSVESDRLAARKRRFGDLGGKTVRQKRSRQEEDSSQLSDFGSSTTYMKEPDTDKHKDPQRRDARLKTEKGAIQKDGPEDLRGQREKSEGSIDPSESKRQQGSTSSRRVSLEGNSDQSVVKEQEQNATFKLNQNAETNKNTKNKEDHVDIDLSQSYRKQMEQNRRLHLQQQQQRESDKLKKAESLQRNETEDLEHRSLVHEVGKPPEDVTDNFPSHKLSDQFEVEPGIKRERVYRRQKSEDPDWSSTPSPGHQVFSQHADEDFMDASLKELSRNNQKIHPELELLVKRTHNTQVNKTNAPINIIEEDQQKRWESRVKQDLLPNLNFSRNLSKNLHNRKPSDYGLWHDLEPGEVRSDSEEDRENKPLSPAPSTSMPFSDRQRPDRFSDPKLAHLERNKFYSLALDETITPDTKALLERAKSLSSSREDNWSFLDYDSHFVNFRSQKDTEKVESAPRPTPSWYMKKKKIRSGSEDKLDDRKEESKPEEQERRELFASRFLHSAVFELDSRRLQHLERKYEELEHMLNQQASQQGAEGEHETGPVVLFHSRFLELTQLQQQKNKSQQLQEDKANTVCTNENKEEKLSDQEQHVLRSNDTSESSVIALVKPISPVEQVVPEPRLTPNLVTPSVIKDTPLSDQKCVLPNPPTNVCPLVSFTKEEMKEEVKESEDIVPMHHPPTETLKSEPASETVPETKISEEKLEFIAEDAKPPVADQTHYPGSHEELVCRSEPELGPETLQPEVPTTCSPVQSRLVEDADVIKEEPHSTCQTAVESEGEKRLEVSKEQISVDSDTIEEPVPFQKESKTKEMKTKKGKQSPAQVPLTSISVSEKQATRKSERIDKDKLKRGSSPRAETKSTAKSPIPGSDHDHFEQSIPISRARTRRNVKSVYATPVEDDAPTRGKEITESPRSARKRGTEKEAAQHSTELEPPAPTPVKQRGRPPKNRRPVEEISSAKAEKIKMDSKDADSNESESGERISRVAKGKTSPHLAKGSLNPIPSATGSKKGDKAEATDEKQVIHFTETDTLSTQHSLDSGKDSSVKSDVKKGEKDKLGAELGKDKDVHEKICEGKSNGKETDSLVVEEKLVQEKDKILRGKIKSTGAPKPHVLKDLQIRLNVTEVKDLLQLGDEEFGNQEDSSKKVRPGDLNEHVSRCTSANKECPNEEKEEKDMDASKSSILQERELEQAVENIAKFTEPAFTTELATPPVPPAERKSDPEEEKPCNPASETELMAAIDSITAEDASVSLTPAAPISTDVCSEPEIHDFVQPVKVEESQTAMQEEPVFSNTPKKGYKGRPKTPKRSKALKHARKDVKEEPSISEELAVRLAETTASDIKIVSEKPPSAAAAVITPVSWISESELPAVKAAGSELPSSVEEQPQAVHPQAKSPMYSKPHQLPADCVSPLLASNRPNIRSIQTSRAPVSPPDWRHQTKDACVSSAHIMLVAAKESQPASSDSNKELDQGTSDLRQILMKPKAVSVPTNLPSLRDQNPSESNPAITAAIQNRSPLPDSKTATHSAPPIVRTPSTLTSETKSVISVIASTATSVISRVCNPLESEEKANLNIGNPSMDMSLPKTAYRPSKDDTGPYHGPPDEAGTRFIVDAPTYSSGSCSGLRVNTSEGVVVLSHSGKKNEGPLRISAKISQIPQATAGDMESQQLMSIPQIKQDVYGHSQSGHQKGPSQTDHGHPGKPQSALSSIKQESSSLDKMDSAYLCGSQGVVKRLPQGNQQVMGYHQDYLHLKHQKKMDNVDPHGADGAKPSWTSTVSPAISPHLPSPPGNHVGFVTSAGERNPSHLSGIKQEPRSPRKSGHPHPTFTKVSSPLGSSSPKGISVMLSSALNPMQQFMTGVHHPEQSVIMQPHSVPGGLGRMSPHCVSQSIPVGHLVQGEVRVNTPPLSVMNYVHSDQLASPWSGSMQPRSSSPQAVGRDMVLKVNHGSLLGHEGEQKESRHFHQAGRPSATLPSDTRGTLRTNVPLETFMAQRDMRVHLHQPGERLTLDPHSGHIQETLQPSLSPRAHILPKGVSDKDIKSLEAKRPHSPLPKDGMMGIRQSGPAIASPQTAPLMPPGPSGSFSEYSGMYPNRIQSQIPDTSVGHNQPPLNVTPSMGAELQTKPDGKMTQPVNMVQLLTAKCDMETAGGGWTLIQNRQDGSVDFNKTWQEYREGFGSLQGEHWLGNAALHALTSTGEHQLRIELEDWYHQKRQATYSNFKVASEAQRYRLTAHEYSGDAGNALSYSKRYNHDGRPFSTADRDHDRYTSGNCGQYYGAGWWFDACLAANLNGRYYRGRYTGLTNGIYWGTWYILTDGRTGERYSFKRVEMKTRPKNFGGTK
ncbi:hypothetical protein XENOCAPTIV_028530 [Xenoophorus captivus]|uniref:Fibrinogen C-terminal domain-containing protein n=1 Tax=Xenoophorus captivus TaxID=1517983 RepID=A0ABV0R4D7_9TELE